MAVAGDDKTFERPGPMIFDRLGHRAGGLAGPNHDCAPGRARRQMRRQALCRRGCIDSRLEHVQKNFARVERHFEL